MARQGNPNFLIQSELGWNCLKRGPLHQAEKWEDVSQPIQEEAQASGISLAIPRLVKWVRLMLGREPGCKDLWQTKGQCKLLMIHLAKKMGIKYEMQIWNIYISIWRQKEVEEKAIKYEILRYQYEDRTRWKIATQTLERKACKYEIKYHIKNEYVRMG